MLVDFYTPFLEFNFPKNYATDFSINIELTRYIPEHDIETEFAKFFGTSLAHLWHIYGTSLAPEWHRNGTSLAQLIYT